MATPAGVSATGSQRAIRDGDRRIGMEPIVRDDAIRSGSTRIDGTRITVLDVKRRVIDGEEDSHVVAGEYGISMADPFGALAYYYDRRGEFIRREARLEATRREGERRSQDLVGNPAVSSEQAD
ncbi:MAG: DUF433 domain-containing protein [Halapricum sp.]